jgi:hypothetical protein
MKTSLVDVLMMGTGFGANSNYFTAVGEKPSPISGSFVFSVLGDFLVAGFLEGIVPATEKIL